MAPPTASLKPVQELLEGGIVPESYLQHHTDDHDQLSVPLMDIPIIDYSLLFSSNSDELQKLRSALSSWGCFQLVNHGMTSELLDEVREMGKEFFKLPLEQKEKYSSKDGSLEGYGNDNSIRQANFNWNDKLHLQVYPQHKHQVLFWPQYPLNFRETLHEYSAKTKLVTNTLLKAMSSSLKLDENRFYELWGDDKEDEMHARFNFYPRCPNASQVVGLKAHTDGSAITILLQDKDIEGLQVLKDNQWFRVPIIPHALVIHVGDQLEIASNGIFKSPIHKVVINPQCDRISLAMLPLPNKEKEIGPFKELITEDRPQLFKRLKDYGQVYFKYMASEKRQIEFVKINYD
ncbi:jasmonate-induced oxygenase 4-like [Amaranthus tricolor]|uniref:jasmonate-induced oxygenase 4-like n=1 Tax=Amaranthus tricolor TaxID=29722 RepID=UPI00258D8A0C|nr:jasmonate-induced oxygenase 4-like [Amaranthus tricolor]